MTTDLADRSDPRIAIVTPSFARDFEMCRALNETVLQFLPPRTRHYIIVDGRDIPLFARLTSPRTIIAAVEDVIPKGYFKLPFVKKWWFSTPALLPAKGWLVQQLVKMSLPDFATEEVLVNVDSDVRFVRPVDVGLFVRNGKTRMYRLPRGIVAGMQHVKWHNNVCRLLDVPRDRLPMDEYVGNMISWDRRIVLEARARVEAVTGAAWHVSFTRARLVSEYFTYGLYVDKVLGGDTSRLWYDERPWCHTYWGPGPLPRGQIEQLVDGLRSDDVAFSIAGYTGTDIDVTREATELVIARVGS